MQMFFCMNFIKKKIMARVRYLINIEMENMKKKKPLKVKINHRS